MKSNNKQNKKNKKKNKKQGGASQANAEEQSPNAEVIQNVE